MSKDLRRNDRYIFVNGHIMAKPEYQVELSQKQKEKLQQYNDIMQSQLINYYGEPQNSEDFKTMIDDAKSGEKRSTFEQNKKSAMVILERLYDKLYDKQKGENLMLLYDMIKNESDMKKYDEISDVSRRLSQQSNLLNTDNEIESYINDILKYITTGEIERSLYKKNLKFDTNDKISQVLNKLSNIQTSGNEKLVKQLEKLASTNSTKKQEQGISVLDDLMNADIDTVIVENYTKQIQDINDQKTVASTEIMAPPFKLTKSQSAISKKELETALRENDYLDEILQQFEPNNVKDIDLSKFKEYITEPDKIDGNQFIYTKLNDKDESINHKINLNKMDTYSKIRLLEGIDNKKLIESNDQELIDMYNSFNTEFDKHGDVLQQVKEDKKKYDKQKAEDDAKAVKEAKQKAEDDAKAAKEAKQKAEDLEKLKYNYSANFATLAEYKKIREFFQPTLKSQLSELNILQQIGKTSQYNYKDKKWVLKDITMKNMYEFKKILDKKLKISDKYNIKDTDGYKQLTKYVNEVNKIIG